MFRQPLFSGDVVACFFHGRILAVGWSGRPSVVRHGDGPVVEGREEKMNPASFMKLMSAKAQFERNHPKFVAFVKTVFSRPVEEGTVVEITITRPGEAPLTANLKVQQSDLELLTELRELGQQ